jgi:predicted TIM-barrel fold metal-dependent hydrolase
VEDFGNVAELTRIPSLLKNIFCPTGIIDSHCHFGKWGPQQYFNRIIDPFSGKGLATPEDVTHYCDKKQLSMIILVPIYESNIERSYAHNEGILKCAKASKNLIVPGFWVDPLLGSRKLLKDAISLAADTGIRVLKMSPSNWQGGYSADPDTWDASFIDGINFITNYGRRERCVIQIHTGGQKSDIRAVEKMMRRLADGLTFHLVHMGGRINSHFYFIPRLAEWLDEGLDVYCDTSLATDFAVRWIVAEALRNPRILPRILFASDAPWGTHETELMKLIIATNGEEHPLKLILFDNAFGLYADKRLQH